MDEYLTKPVYLPALKSTLAAVFHTEVRVPAFEDYST
jgi:hypothetical protein